MPRTKRRTYTDEQLRAASIEQDSPDTPLIAEEAGVLLGGIGEEGMRARRRDGQPPPFTQARPRGAVRYLLGDVLAARKMHRHQSTQEVRHAHQIEVLGYPTLSAWLTNAAADEEWIFSRVGPHRRPVDLLTAIRTVPIAQRHGVRTLSLESYLEALQKSSDSEAEAIKNAADHRAERTAMAKQARAVHAPKQPVRPSAGNKRG